MEHQMAFSRRRRNRSRMGMTEIDRARGFFEFSCGAGYVPDADTNLKRTACAGQHHSSSASNSPFRQPCLLPALSLRAVVTMSLAVRKRGHRWAALSLRILSVLQLLTGLGFIGFSCYLHIPPEDSLTLGLIVIGALAVATAVFGITMACSKSCCVSSCLSVYLTLGVLVTLAQAGFALYLFIAPQNAVDKLMAYQKSNSKDSEDKFRKAIFIGRWVFLGLMGVQLLAMLVALVLRAVSLKEGEYRDFEQEEYEERKAKTERQMELLKEKIQGIEGGRSPAKSPSKSPSKAAIHLAATTAPTLPQQRRSLFRSESEDAKLDSDLEIGTIPAAMPPNAANSVRAWAAKPQAPAWPAAEQPQQQRSFKPSWTSKTGQDTR